jgi:hypothetical protein
MPSDLEERPLHPSEIQQRRRQARGLLLIAGIVLVASILRTGVHRVFTSGWWHLW